MQSKTLGRGTAWIGKAPGHDVTLGDMVGLSLVSFGRQRSSPLLQQPDLLQGFCHSLSTCNMLSSFVHNPSEALSAEIVESHHYCKVSNVTGKPWTMCCKLVTRAHKVLMIMQQTSGMHGARR